MSSNAFRSARVVSESGCVAVFWPARPRDMRRIWRAAAIRALVIAMYVGGVAHFAHSLTRTGRCVGDIDEALITASSIGTHQRAAATNRADTVAGTCGWR